jgi:enamine deaminase RidA (YjgF/YER057c/UK114 family)
MAFELINPDSLGAPKGYTNGVLADAGGKLLFIAGQVAWDKQQKIVSDDFVEQFDQALANVITVLKAAGGEPANVARLAIYVTSRVEYLGRTIQVGLRYRKHMGNYFPAMVLVEVGGLVDNAAKVEIEGMAVIPA